MRLAAFLFLGLSCGALVGQANRFAVEFAAGRIDLPYDPLMNTGDAVTIEAWLRSSQAPAPTAELSMFTRYRASREHKGLHVLGDGSVRAIYAGSPWPAQGTPPGTFAFDGQWHHVAFVRRSAGTYSLFYDGREMLSSGPGPCWLTCNIINSDPTTWVGGDPSATNPPSYQLRELRVSTVARYAGAFTPTSDWQPDPQTAMLLPFAEGQGSTTADLGPARQVGTLVGTVRWIPLTGSAARWWILGQGCGGSATPPRLDAVTLPRLGTDFTLRASSLPLHEVGVLFWGFRDDFFGQPLPVDLAAIGLPNCLFFSSGEFAIPFSSGAQGAYDSTVGVPTDSALSGLQFRNQVLVRDPTVGPIGINAANGGEGVVGL